MVRRNAALTLPILVPVGWFSTTVNRCIDLLNTTGVGDVSSVARRTRKATVEEKMPSVTVIFVLMEDRTSSAKDTTPKKKRIIYKKLPTD